jgi:MFS family permease
MSRSVTALLVAVFTSSSAHAVGAVAVGKQVFDITGHALDLGLLGLAEFLPVVLLVVFAGHLADRYDRRLVAIGGLGLEAVAAVALFAYVASEPTSVGPMFALVAVFGTGRAIGAPAARSLPADIVAADRLPWLVPRYSACWQAAAIGGPVLAGFLYASDPALPYVAMLVLLGVAAGALVLVVPLHKVTRPEEAAPDADDGGLHDAFEGLRFIRREPILLGAIGLDLFAVLFGGVVGLLPAIATDRLGVDAIGLGWLRAAGGIGAASVTVALAVHPIRRRVGHRLLATVALFGAATVVLGVTGSFAVALVAMLVLSGADAVSVFIRATLVPLVTPERMRGRVFAVENVFIGGSNQAGDLESGIAGQVLGVGPAVVAGGLATMAIAGLWWFAFPSLRSLDRFPTEPSAVPAATPAAP